jgi:prepilin-type N-terminal cleavage/methylation domain-containing protein
MDLANASSRRAVAGDRGGFTLPEVLMCVVVAVIAFAGMITGFVQCSRRAEWAGYSLAAQALAIQAMEQARSARWDVQSAMTTVTVNELTNMPLTNVMIMDLPVTGTNNVYATNFLTITNVPITSKGISVYMVKVNTVWSFRWGLKNRLYTNTLVDYYAQD